MIKKRIFKSYEERERELRSLYDTSEMPVELYVYLRDNGILTCPASTKYHGAYEGGLFDHCYHVYMALKELTFRLNIEWSNPHSPCVVAFGHDICKLDNYIEVVDKEKVQELENGTQIVIPESSHYEYNSNSVLHGHAIKSVILLQQHLRLTEEEMYCILYHMGAYEKDQWDAYRKAIEKYPNVLMTHTADMLASAYLGI